VSNPEIGVETVPAPLPLCAIGGYKLLESIADRSAVVWFVLVLAFFLFLLSTVAQQQPNPRRESF